MRLMRCLYLRAKKKNTNYTRQEHRRKTSRLQNNLMRSDDEQALCFEQTNHTSRKNFVMQEVAPHSQELWCCDIIECDHHYVRSRLFSLLSENLNQCAAPSVMKKVVLLGAHDFSEELQQVGSSLFDRNHTEW